MICKCGVIRNTDMVVKLCLTCTKYKTPFFVNNICYDILCGQSLNVQSLSGIEIGSDKIL